MFIYNVSLTLFFWTLFNFIFSDLKTLHSFSNLILNSFYAVVLTLLLLSMAGVPPFIGFFAKIFIITLLLGSSLFLLGPFLITVLFISLYFYVQNLRFLHSTVTTNLNYPFIFNERHVILFYYAANIISTLIVLGFLFIEDVFLLFSWILI